MVIREQSTECGKQINKHNHSVKNEYAKLAAYNCYKTKTEHTWSPQRAENLVRERFQPELPFVAPPWNGLLDPSLAAGKQ